MVVPAASWTLRSGLGGANRWVATPTPQPGGTEFCGCTAPDHCDCRAETICSVRVPPPLALFLLRFTLGLGTGHTTRTSPGCLPDTPPTAPPPSRRTPPLSSALPPSVRIP